MASDGEGEWRLLSTVVGMKKILVPLDGSSLAEAALPHAREVARACGGALLVLTCTLPTDAVVVRPALDPAERRSDLLVAQEQHRAEAYLSGVEADGRQVVTGDPAEEIVSFARREGVDLIVISSHGRGALGRLVFGSVAEHVMHHAPCPVMVVKDHS